MTGSALRGRPLTHGHTCEQKTTPEFRTWCAMRQRCGNHKHAKYPRYGGRGIRVCDRWQSFENFLADMGPRPLGTTIDRINVDGNYEPGNCRWATPTEQANNRPKERSAWKANNTHCPSGHPYAGENLIATPSGRKCRICQNAGARARRRKK